MRKKSNALGKSKKNTELGSVSHQRTKEHEVFTYQQTRACLNENVQSKKRVEGKRISREVKAWGVSATSVSEPSLRRHKNPHFGL